MKTETMIRASQYIETGLPDRTTTIDRNKTEQELLEFVRSRARQPAQVTQQTDLIKEGVLDSLLLVDLIFLLEESYGIRFESEHIDPTNFCSIEAIASLVAERVSAAGKTP